MSSTVTTQFLIPGSIASALPAMVRNELSQSPPRDQAAFLEDYSRQKKSTGIAYLLWFCLGLHYGYMGRWGIQFLYWFTLGGLMFWCVADLFRVPGMISNYNRDKATDVMRNLRIIGS